MRKTKKYIVSVSYEDKTEIFRHITAHTRQEAALLVISLFLIKDEKYNCRPLTSYKIISCLENKE